MKYRLDHNLGLIVKVSVAVALISIVGCSRPAGMIFTPLAEPLIWPQPPETPRIAYVGMIATEDDLKPAVSWSQGLMELVFGKEDIGILVSPTAVMCDNEKMFVTDIGAGTVHIFDLETRQYKQVSSLGPEETMIMPVAMTFMQENICITDSVKKAVYVFDQEGNFIFSFGQDVLSRPTGIAFDASSQRVYVADTANHHIKVFDQAGNLVSEIGSRGVEAGQFNFPTHLWMAQDGKLYVSDTLNYRVQVFTADGTFIRTFGSHGDRPGNFAHPAGIATDSQGHIYVVDKQYENIQIFDNDGHVLMAFGTEGNGPGNFWLPSGLFICKDDNIYVADSFNKRVQVFEFLKEQINNEN